MPPTILECLPAPAMTRTEQPPALSEPTIAASESIVAVTGLTIGCRRIDGICRWRDFCQTEKKCQDPEGL